MRRRIAAIARLVALWAWNSWTRARWGLMWGRLPAGGTCEADLTRLLVLVSYLSRWRRRARSFALLAGQSQSSSDCALKSLHGLHVCHGGIHRISQSFFFFPTGPCCVWFVSFKGCRAGDAFPWQSAGDMMLSELEVRRGCLFADKQGHERPAGQTLC